jgi:hypothetical protein
MQPPVGANEVNSEAEEDHLDYDKGGLDRIVLTDRSEAVGQQFKPSVVQHSKSIREKHGGHPNTCNHQWSRFMSKRGAHYIPVSQAILAELSDWCVECLEKLRVPEAIQHGDDG